MTRPGPPARCQTPASQTPASQTPGFRARGWSRQHRSPPRPLRPLRPLRPAPPVPAQAAPSDAAAPSLKIKHTRTSGLWVAVGFFAVLLLLLLIFILQNSRTVDVSYMGAHGHLPLGVALLLAAVGGVLLVVLAGAARISQLRTVARRHRRAHAKQAKAANKAAS